MGECACSLRDLQLSGNRGGRPTKNNKKGKVEYSEFDHDNDDDDNEHSDYSVSETESTTTPGPTPGGNGNDNDNNTHTTRYKSRKSWTDKSINEVMSDMNKRIELLEQVIRLEDKLTSQGYLENDENQQLLNLKFQLHSQNSEDSCSIIENNMDAKEELKMLQQLREKNSNIKSSNNNQESNSKVAVINSNSNSSIRTDSDYSSNNNNYHNQLTDESKAVDL